ncbi:ATP-dependent RecD-like DNA helicase [Leptolyngbya sp. FACHB-261]|uniref:SF1B family DNA helicase RecD2 n=1 Tax=Leptolyngbya sp. FACHB-261 TaxID=2692806 RepID=UPI0016870479|nr:ATP-dependent RecD-like DNA helicase [Leptolyngbya sp. FACHB-261]MBD2103208.1 ATP-dependent RecD-like DNA helicase [Leptolyngbya sp. FACHB-261]
MASYRTEPESSAAPSPEVRTQPLEVLQGVVERLTYHSAENGYTVARLQVRGVRELTTIVGNFPNIQAGQTLQLQGQWRDHPKFGPQFQVNQYRETKPATLTGIEKYLGSGLIKGVGPVTAKRIVAHFGLQTLEIIENDIQRLGEAPGVGRKRVRMIASAWEEQKIIKEVMVFLQGHGVSTTHAVKIYKTYRDEAITVVSQNPYRLAQDIWGIGFITADTIARNLGIAPDSQHRYRAGLVHVLATATEEGHCYLPIAELVERGIALLSLKDFTPDAEAIKALLYEMAIGDELVMQGLEGEMVCYRPSLYHAEQNLANRLRQWAALPLSVDSQRVQNWLDRFTAKYQIQLSEQQRQAVELAASSRVLILTGGPGTGKTTTTRTIVALWKAMGRKLALASPTGRAAQRLAEVTGQEAKTLHRLLEFDPRTADFKRGRENPIEADALVIDEASMLDLPLAYALVRAIALDAQLLLVGDIDQLPSVGPGKVLQDLIASEQLPVVRLTAVFRQAASSRIITNAHQINQGNYPELEPIRAQPSSDCLFLQANEPEHVVQGIQDVLQHLIPDLGFIPNQDVQVLSPMIRGQVGTRNLNQVLQAQLNPAGPGRAEVQRGGLTLRVGDRVIQQVNDYDREVFNGDLGIIAAIDLEEQEVTVRFGKRLVTYDSADLNTLTLAWAITIHKAQGSECPVVILPIHTQHYTMLSRNLLYTGLTRARRLAVLVGTRKAIGMAVRQVKDSERYTALNKRLVRGHPG